jgi:hypothetical protein
MVEIELNDMDPEAHAPVVKRNGYGFMGKLIGEAPETGIFRSFAALSAENLLYLQAELVSLETDWHALQEANKTSTDISKQRRIYDWDDLRNSGEAEDSENQWEDMLNIRKTLKEYRTMLRNLFVNNAN